MNSSSALNVTVELPCVGCDSPRIGIDFDDVYKIVPGRNPRRERCECVTCHHFDASDPRYAASLGTLPHYATCPDCGHLLLLVFPCVWPDRVMRCEESRGRWIYDRLAGCPQCRESVSWIGVDADESL